MESAQNLKRRIKSVQNIGQITKAMELVAATKMRKAQELALDSRPYAYTAVELLGILSSLKDVQVPPLLERRPVEKTAYLLITSDKGLAGAFNGAVTRLFESYMKKNGIDPRNASNVFISVGQKAKSYLERRKLPIIASFTRVGDFTKVEQVEPIADTMIQGYLRGDFDRAVVFYTTFVTALRQEAVVREFLPITHEQIMQSIEETIPVAGRYSEYAKSESFFENSDREYAIEPSPYEVLNMLAPQLLKIRLYHAILEANASEHSARRMAMKNASENASDISSRLSVEYNKSRQAAITREIIEVTSGAEALA